MARPSGSEAPAAGPGASPVLFLNVAQLEEDVQQLQYNLNNKDRTIAELRARLLRLEDTKQQLADAVQELQEARREIETLRSGAPAGGHGPGTPAGGSAWHDASRSRPSTCTSLVVPESRCITPASDLQDSSSVVVRVSAVARALPPIHPAFTQASNFASPAKTVATPPSAARLAARPRTPGEAVLCSWPSNRQEVARFNRIASSRGPAQPRPRSSLPVGAQPGILSVAAMTDRETRSVGAQASPLPWTRFYFSDLQMGVCSSSSKNPLYHHFDVEIDPAGEVVQPGDFPAPGVFQVPEWAPKEFHKLYYAFMDDAQRSKQRELRSQDGRARGAGARVDRDVNQPWHLLSEDILANADHRDVGNFCSQVVRLKPRNDADSRPLCLLLAGVITSLASQLTHSIEAHRAHSERLMDKLRQEMADMQERLERQLEDLHVDHTQKHMVRDVIDKFRGSANQALASARVAQATDAVEEATSELSELRSQAEAQKQELQTAQMAGAQLHYRIEQLECQLDEANLKLEEFGQSAPPTDPAKDQALSVLLKDADAELENAAAESIEPADETVQLADETVQLVDEAVQLAEDTVQLADRSSEDARGEPQERERLPAEAELESATAIAELQRVNHRLSKSLQHKGKEMDVLKRQFTVLQRQRDAAFKMCQDLKRLGMVQRMKYSARINELETLVRSVEARHAGALEAMAVMDQKASELVEEITAMSMENVQMQEIAAKARIEITNQRREREKAARAMETLQGTVDASVAGAEAERQAAQQARDEMLYVNEEKKQLERDMRSLQEETERKVENVRMATELALKHNDADLELNIQGLTDEEDIAKLRAEAESKGAAIRAAMEAKTEAAWEVTRRRLAIVKWDKARVTISRMGNAVGGMKMRTLSSRALEAMKGARAQDNDADPEAGGDGSDPTAKEELLANLHRAESAELHAEATFSELMRATAVYGSEAAFEFAMQDEKVEGQTLEMTQLESAHVKQQLDDAQRHAQAQLLMLHTTDESFLELLFGSNGRWCEVSTYEGMQELAVSAMDQLQTLFKTDAAMLELMLDQSGALADEVEDESSESYSAWSLMVQYVTGPVPNQLISGEMVDASASMNYLEAANTTRTVLVSHAGGVREVVTPILYPTLTHPSGAQRCHGTLSVFLHQRRLDTLAALKSVTSYELERSIISFQETIATGIGKMAEHLERFNMSELERVHSQRLQMKAQSSSALLDPQTVLKLELEELLRNKRRLELMLSKRFMRNHLGALKRYPVLNQAAVGALCSVFLILEYQGAADYLPTSEEGFLSIPNHPNKLKELWKLKNRLLNLNKLVLDMKRYDSMVLIPEGDTDVDNDGMGDAIMMRMANVEAILESIGYEELRKTAPAGVMHEWAITCVRIQQAHAKLTSLEMGKTHLAEVSRLQDRVVETETAINSQHMRQMSADETNVVRNTRRLSSSAQRTMNGGNPFKKAQKFTEHGIEDSDQMWQPKTGNA